MANNGGRRTSAPGNNSSLILGILIGTVIGLAVAGGVAWHLSSRPSAFTSKEQHETTAATPSAQTTPAQKPQVTATAPAASGVDGKKQHFTFYEILPDKEKNASSKGAAHTPTKEPKDSANVPGAAYFLQAGSFASADDADKLKAKLALLGMEASVQTADVPGKGTRYRVRLGPYHNADEANKANVALKQNQINDAAIVHGQ